MEREDNDSPSLELGVALRHLLLAEEIRKRLLRRQQGGFASELWQRAQWDNFSVTIEN